MCSIYIVCVCDLFAFDKAYMFNVTHSEILQQLNENADMLI